MSETKKGFPILSVLCFSFFAIVFVTASVLLLQNKLTERKEQSGFEQLAQLARQAGTSQEPEPDKASLTADPVATPKPTVLPQYQQLKALNGDLYGWISIEDTEIDYPVMLTPEAPEKYLHLDFDGQYSFSGVPFADAGTAEASVNTLVYGHHMQNGTMFAGLMKYVDSSYRNAHPAIRFDTVYQTGEYEVLAAFYSQIYYSPSKTDFVYYDYSNINSEKQFDEYVAKCKEASLYDTGVDAQWGDKLITLSTCAYHVANGRFVVVARSCQGKPGTAAQTQAAQTVGSVLAGAME